MRAFLQFTVFFFLATQAFAFIDIDIDEDDCIDGRISMDVEITVDGEDFDFSPSCNFSFDDDFETKSGIKCEVEAGMCSSFSPERALEVECDNGEDEDVEIPCPEA